MAKREAERLTKTRVEELAAEAEGDRLVYDAEVPGFAVRLRPGRVPSFEYVYRSGGRFRRYGLGQLGELTVEQARTAAREARRVHRAGGDPQAARRAERVRELTFADGAKLYLADLEARAAAGAKRGKASTVAEFRRLLERVILPGLGGELLAELDVAALERWHRSLAATPAQANRGLTVALAVLRFAERRKLRPAGMLPARPVEKLAEAAEAPAFTLADLEKLGAALRAAEGTAAPAVALGLRLLALTGMRRSEVYGHALKARRSEGAGLRWRDVDLERGELTLRAAKAGARRVVLARPAVELLRAARPADVDPEAFVCPGEGGAPFVGIDKAARRLFAAAGIVGGLHSLRRAFATVAAEAGLGEFVIAGLLGHGKGSSVTARYVVPGLDPLRAAAELVAGTIAAALDGRPAAEVVPIRGRA